MGKKKKVFRRNLLRAKKAQSLSQPPVVPAVEVVSEEKPKIKAKAKKTSKKRTSKKRSPKK